MEQFYSSRRRICPPAEIEIINDITKKIKYKILTDDYLDKITTQLKQLIVEPKKDGPRGNWALQFQDCFFVQPTNGEENDFEAFEAELDEIPDYDDYRPDN